MLHKQIMNYPFKENPDWDLVRPDTAFYSNMIEKLEVSGITAQRLNSLENFTTNIQAENTYGIIIHYKNSEKWGFQSNKDLRDNNIFFAKQTQDYASPTMALINILCNLDIEKGELLQAIFDNYLYPSPSHEKLARCNKLVKDLHNSCHNNGQSGEPVAPDINRDDEARIQNVVSYIHKYGSVWKFNNQKDYASKMEISGVWFLGLQALLEEKWETIVDIIALVKTPPFNKALKLSNGTPDDNVLEEDTVMLEDQTDSSDITEDSSEELDPPKKKTKWYRQGQEVASPESKRRAQNGHTRANSAPMKKITKAKGRKRKAKSAPESIGRGRPKKVKISHTNDTASNENSTASGGACSKKKGQKCSHEDNETENKRHRNARNKYFLRH